MGCGCTKKQMIITEPTIGNQDDSFISKIRDLSTQRNLANEAELALIKLTYTNLKEVNNERRSIWLETINNDILSPIYFSTISNFPYSSQSPFHPNAEILKSLHSKDYESLKKSKSELCLSLLHIFYNYYLTFKIDILKLQRLILAICENYQDNPFHNFYHAFSVCQMIYALSESHKQFDDFLSTQDTFALLISALGHDLNHPGVTNIFMINSRHSLAVMYNDSSVLENHHASTLIKFLELPGCDIFTSSSCDPNSMRKLLIETILATDMGKHNFVMEKFLSVIGKYEKNNKDHRQSFADIILHACDIGNPVLKFDLATAWSFKIIQEFNDQVWKEEKLGIPVSEYMRIGSDLTKIKRNQIAFIDMFIHPLWLVLGQHLENIQEYLDSIEKNRENWESLEALNL